MKAHAIARAAAANPIPVVLPRDNPFSVQRIERLEYRALGFSWEQLLLRLAELRWRGALVGGKGSGKTTLLLELASRLGEQALVLRIPSSCRHPFRHVVSMLPSALNPDSVVLIDGCEQLGALAWARLTRRLRATRGLVITAHSPGRLATLFECRTSCVLLDELVQELAPGQLERLRSLLPRIYDATGGNLRLCMRELYDLCAGRVRGARLP